MTDLAVADPPATPPAAAVSRPALRKILHRAAGWALFAAIVVAALVAGLVLRRWAWDQTEPIRYVADINNAFRQGTQTLQIGYIDRYDQQQSQPDSQQGIMDLDYAPGRLAVATLWTYWVREKVDGPITDPKKIKAWQLPFYRRASLLHLVDRLGPLQHDNISESITQPGDPHLQYQLVKPMLMVNLTGEILTAIAMFFLVRRYASGNPKRAAHEVSGNAKQDRLLRARLSPHPLRGTILGLVAALFFWFDPALISNAHCWPQWDSWVMPFFMWAVLLASWDWWFCSGVLIATGAMFKGQILFGAPVFLLWPLFQGRLPALCRWIVGSFTAVAAITAVWLVRIPGTNPTGEHFYPGSVNPHAIAWLIYLALIFVTMPATLWWPRSRLARIPLAMALAAIIMWIIGAHTTQTFSVLGFVVLTAAAWFVDDRCAKWSWHAKLPLGWLAVALLFYPLYTLAKDPVIVLKLILGTIGVVMMLAYAPRRVLPYAAAGWMSAALLLCIPVFGAKTGWFDLGIAYGTHHSAVMASGSVNNLPELLQSRWGWDDLMAPAYTLHAGTTADYVAAFLTQVDPGVHLRPGADVDLPLKYFLVGIWLLAVVICAMGAAIHDRNRSPRFLAAIVAPWIVFFAVMAQMHQRYLLWGASLSAASAVLSPGYALLHLFLSAVSTSQEMHTMMNNPLDPANHGQYTHYFVYQFVESWHPGIAWAVLLTAAIFVYTAVKWDRVRK